MCFPSERVPDAAEDLSAVIQTRTAAGELRPLGLKVLSRSAKDRGDLPEQPPGYPCPAATALMLRKGEKKRVLGPSEI